MSPRDENERIGDIVQAIDAIDEHRRRAVQAGFAPDDPMLLDAVVRQLPVIGEAATHLSTALTERNPAIPWQGVKGMRLLLDHEYHRVDADIVWRTVTGDLPALKLALENVSRS